MPDCDYCEEAFDSEEAYLQHLATTHEGELSLIDQRRIEDVDVEEEGIEIDPGPIIILIIFLLSAAAVAAIFLPGGEGAPTPAENAVGELVTTDHLTDSGIGFIAVPADATASAWIVDAHG